LTFFFSEIALAGIQEYKHLDQIIEEYRKAAAHWGPVLKHYAYNLFWSLALIEFAWTGITLVLRQADFTEIVSEGIRRVLYLGFFFAVLDNSQEWSRFIIDSFRTAGARASQATGASGGISPSSIFDIGLELGVKITQDISIISPGDAIGLVISGLIVLICFALIAALLLLALVEMYLVLNAGILLMGFAGSKFTQEYAMKHLNYTISVGAKIFVMQLLVGVSESFIMSWKTNFSNENNVQVLVLIGASVVMLALVKTIPDIIQGLISGVSIGAGNSMVSTVAQVGSIATGVGAAAAATTAGTAMAGSNAWSLAKAQGASGMMSQGFGAMKNMAQAAGQDLAGKFAGVPGSGYGSMTGRMASAMKQKSEELTKASFDLAPAGSSENSISSGAGAGAGAGAGSTDKQVPGSSQENSASIPLESSSTSNGAVSSDPEMHTPRPESTDTGSQESASIKSEALSGRQAAANTSPEKAIPVDSAPVSNSNLNIGDGHARKDK